MKTLWLIPSTAPIHGPPSVQVIFEHRGLRPELMQQREQDLLKILSARPGDSFSWSKDGSYTSHVHRYRIRGMNPRIHETCWSVHWSDSEDLSSISSDQYHHKIPTTHLEALLRGKHIIKHVLPTTMTIYHHYHHQGLCFRSFYQTSSSTFSYL